MASMRRVPRSGPGDPSNTRRCGQSPGGGMHPAAMDARLARLREALASLAARSRFEMLVQLAGAERCVTELAADVGLSQSCTTRHLQALSRAGLVRGRRDGRRVLFSAVREHAELASLLATLARLGGA